VATPIHTVLCEAALCGSVNTAKVLLDSGANINQAKVISYTPLNLAISHDKT